MLKMDAKSPLLSEENIELCSSFEFNSESDTSLVITPLSLKCRPVRNNTYNEDSFFKSPESFLFSNKFTQSREMDNLMLDNAENPLSFNNSSEVESKFNTPENQSLSVVKTFDRLSLDDGQFATASKVKEFKLLLSEANDVYLNYLISQFVLDGYKVVKNQISPELARKVDRAVTSCVVDNLSVLKSKKGEKLNLFGLEKDPICTTTKDTLSSTEKKLVSQQAVAVLESHIRQLSSQHRTLKGTYGAHCRKVVQPDSLLCEERENYADLHNCVQSQLDQACQLLVSTNQLMQQLAHMLKTSEQDLVEATFINLRDKAKCLQSTASVLRLKMESRLYKDKTQTQALNRVGSELKTSVDALSEELKSLQNTLCQYEEKEESSRQYKVLVADYAKTKRQLQHKYQTLNLLNDPDISFS